MDGIDILSLKRTKELSDEERLLKIAKMAGNDSNAVIRALYAEAANEAIHYITMNRIHRYMSNTKKSS